MPGGEGGLFGVINQILHPCGVANIMAYPNRAPRATMITRGGGGVDKNVSHHTVTSL